MTGQYQLDDITTLKLQPLKTNGQEWANSRIKAPNYLHVLQGGTAV